MPDENLSLSNIKLNGTKYELKDGLVRETLLTPSSANIGKVWSTNEVDSGQTTTSDIIAQTTINLNGDPENNPVTIIYWPDEGEEYKVSFDFYNGNTLIESINETLVSNGYDSFSIGFEIYTDYIYVLKNYDKGAYGVFVDLGDKIRAESPYKLVNFHVYQETPIMIPQTGWTSQAVPVPTSNDINKYLQVIQNLETNQNILTYNNISMPVQEITFTGTGDNITCSKTTEEIYNLMSQRILPVVLNYYERIYICNRAYYDERGNYYRAYFYSLEATSNSLIVNYIYMNDSSITSGFINLNNKYMIKGTDYVTAGKKANTTLGTGATAEGYNTTASEDYSHAEGDSTEASGYSSHAEGCETTASGNCSHAEGYGTTAQRESQHVFGEFNILDTTGTTETQGTYVEIVGNGTSINARSNARTLDWFGNEVLAGKLTVGAAPTANMDVATKQYVDSAIPTVPTNISSFTNDAGYLTSAPVTSVNTRTGAVTVNEVPNCTNNDLEKTLMVSYNWEELTDNDFQLNGATGVIDSDINAHTFTNGEKIHILGTLTPGYGQEEIGEQFEGICTYGQSLNGYPLYLQIGADQDGELYLFYDGTRIYVSYHDGREQEYYPLNSSYTLSMVFSVANTVKPVWGNISPASIGASPSNHTHTPASIGAATSSHTHSTTLATSTGTSSITLQHGNKYRLSTGGTGVVFTMPSTPTVPTNVSDLTNDSGFMTSSDVQDFLVDPGVGIDRIRYEFVSELPDLEDPEFVLPNEITFYIVEGDGWYKLNDTVDGWDKINTGYFNYITTTDHTQETPEPNTIYYNTQNNNTYIYDGTSWRIIGYIQLNEDIPTIYTITESNGTYSISPTSTGLSFGINKIKILKYNDEYYYQRDNTHFATLLDSNKTYKEFTLNTQTLGNVSVTSFNTYSTAPTITNTLSSGTLIATINGTNIYAPSYTDADGVSY